MRRCYRTKFTEHKINFVRGNKNSPVTGNSLHFITIVSIRKRKGKGGQK